MEEVNQTSETEIAELAENAESTDAENQKESTGKAQGNMTRTKGGLTLRTIIGAAILYYAYSIVADIDSTPADSRTMLYVFVAVFGVAGIWIIADSLKRIIKKEYEK
jgi:hypothetical protein